MYRRNDRDFLDLEDESDEEGAESSDDDIDILLHGTPEQKRKLCRLGSRTASEHGESASEDEFEKEMNAELDGTVKALEKRRGSVTDPACSSTSQSNSHGETDQPQKYHDDVYYDSDEEEMVTQGDEKSKRKQFTNDELLYDPDIDDDNDKWMLKQRQGYQPKASGNKEKKSKRPANSDAVLDCPACMTTLCLDCQRHDIYDNQYRAMFVLNCIVDKSEKLTYPTNNKKVTKKKRKSEPGVVNDNDTFHGVKCSECNTIVAVHDKDEVYHFFNVLASY